MRTPPAIGFAYRPSSLLAIAAELLGVLALVAIAASGAAPWFAAVLFLLTLGYGACALRRFLRPAVRAVLWREDGGVSIALAAREAQGELREVRVVGPLIVLRLHWPPRGRAALWLLPDNLDADTRRRLRIRLALDGNGASANADKV